jgi:hypothetical protein
LTDDERIVAESLVEQVGQMMRQARSDSVKRLKGQACLLRQQKLREPIAVRG